MKNYRIWDDKEKAPFNSMNYINVDQANEEKARFLDAGNYVDEPHTVIRIHEYDDNTFIQDVTN